MRGGPGRTSSTASTSTRIRSICIRWSSARSMPARLPLRPASARSAARIEARHWRDLAVPSLRPRGTYCRKLAYAPGSPETLYLAAGNDFDGDRGALFVSDDDAASWRMLDLGVPLKTTVFALAVDPNRPDHVFCTTKIGQVFRSTDRGKHWRMNALPAGVGHVFALAVG